MKISELAQQTGCSADTIRFYEKKGLLPVPRRTQSNYRDYDVECVDRLRFIRNCRLLDMTHQEIQQLLQYSSNRQADHTPVHHLLEEHLGHVQKRIAELRHLESQLKALHDCCHGHQTLADCQLLQGIVELDIQTTALSLTKGTH